MNFDEMQIRLRAYAIWEEEGRPAGCEAAHWERAVREMAGNENQAPARQATLKARKAAEKKPARKKAA